MKREPGLLAMCAACAIFAVCAADPAASAPKPPPKSGFEVLIGKSQKEMMADPVTALRDAREAAVLARTFGPKIRSQSTATSLWLAAEALTRINRIGEARAAVTRASRLAASDGRLTKLDGDLALTRARISEAGGDVAGALRNYQDAHNFFVRLGNPRGQSVALQGLGGIYDKAHDFRTEARYYREASQTYSGDPALALSAANNRGFALQQMGRYGDALKDFQAALKIAAALKSGFLEAQILTNVAAAEAKLRRLDEAEAAANRALRLLGPRDEIGGTPFVWGVKGEIDFERGNMARAAADMSKAFHGVDLAHTITPFRDMHEIAYKVYRAHGDLALALEHFEAFKRLDDQGRTLATSANLALSGARFDFTRQQLEIEQLKSVQLQRDISLRRSRAVAQTAIFSAVVLAGVFLFAWIAWRHRLLKQHRNAIARKNVDLTGTLAERNREIQRRTETEWHLRVAMEASQQANRAKTHFLANMSHELRTPLNAVIGFSELLSCGYVQADKAAEYGARIAEGARRLLAILNDMLDMARIEAGKVNLDESEVNLAAVIESAIESLGCQDAPNGRNIRFDSAQCRILVRGDELRLRQIAINLLSNALKFSPDGGEIDISVTRVPDGVDLAVGDNGPGIPPEKLSTIMEPFGQAENAYARAHGGVGLGLPIVKSLLELHGGRFSIHSAPGKTVALAHLPSARVVESGCAPRQTPQAPEMVTATAAA